ncbi:hypothetical protein K443DRAFT_188476 [Laccaria amethystina LaAM-08-1]|jgi:hypothetical protein|uniref:Uncharacterized protein n=1 Tax=Laccaria amethystina LaAM-08-1 TaxID=1095629 RepID=A0A0C9X5V7_9AGAR|nr:hypothetical protein K443DRAFT_188476 [Laccaria amethystina LaAM-08-1]
MLQWTKTKVSTELAQLVKVEWLVAPAVDKPSSLTFGAEQIVDPAPMDEDEGVAGTGTNSQGGMPCGSVSASAISVQYGLTDSLADGGVLNIPCVVPLDIPLFLVEVEVVRDMRRRALRFPISCRSRVVEALRSTLRMEVGCSVRHRLAQGPLPSTLVSHILAAWALCPALGPHRLASFRTAPSIFLPDPDHRCS